MQIQLAPETWHLSLMVREELPTGSFGWES